MVENFTPNPPHEDTAHENDAATVNLSIARMIWRKAVVAEKQLQLMRKLQKLKLGTADVESFLESLEGCKKSKKSKVKTKVKDVDLAREIMDRKVVDADEMMRNSSRIWMTKHN